MVGDEGKPKDRAHEADMLERCKYIFDQVNSWISNADNKVSVSCGIFTGVFGVITFLAERMKEPTMETTSNECWKWIYRSSFVISLILMGVSILFYVLAINPNIKCNEAEKKKHVPIFFGDISRMCNCQYKEAIQSASDEDFCDELLNEAHFNAGIGTRKMKRYRTGLWLSVAAVSMAAISWAAHFLMYSW